MPPKFDTALYCPTSQQPLHRCRWLVPAIVLWVVAVTFGWWSISAYAFKREPTGKTGFVDRWEAGTGLSVDAGRPTLLFFMHPKCPCTTASLAELDRLLLAARNQSHCRPQICLVATVPTDYSADWLNTRTMQQARRLPGTDLFIDRGGREADRFGATTSGTVMWFDADGRRLYAGGITQARGHEGDNLGRDQLARLFRGSLTPVAGIPAFGCTLCLPEK